MKGGNPTQHPKKEHWPAPAKKAPNASVETALLEQHLLAPKRISPGMVQWRWPIRNLDGGGGLPVAVDLQGPWRC